MRMTVGPVAEYNTAPRTANIMYGDAMVTARRHLSPRQFPYPPKIATATDDNGWIGPLGMATPFTPSGSIYGYGVASDRPHY